MRPWGQRFAPDGADRALGWGAFLLLLSVYLLTFNGLPPGPDGEVSFQTTSALARTGSLALGGTPEAEALIEYAEASPPGGFSVRRGAGEGPPRHYGWFGVGHAVTGVPLYALGAGLARLSRGTQAAHAADTRYGAPRSEYYEHLLVGLRNPLLTALTGLLVVLSARRLGVGRLAALLAGLGYGLATFALPQARGWLSDVQGAFALAAAFHALLLLREDFDARHGLLLGLALTLAFTTRVSLLVAVGAMDLALLWLARAVGHPGEAPRRRRGALRVVGAAFAPQALGALLLLALNRLRFGDALDSGYGEALAGGLYGGEPLRGLLGLLVSPGKGLLWMAPALLLAAPGARRLRAAGGRGLPAILGLTALAVALPVVPLVGWHGAWTYGPRYVLPALPLLWILVASGLEGRPGAGWLLGRRAGPGSTAGGLSPLAWLLLLAGVVTQLPGALVDTTTHHELAVAAARERFPEPEGATEADREARRFEALQWDWGFAAPWAHWRILRHRVAFLDGPEGASERFPAAEVFRFPTELVLTPAQPRERGFHHIAWVDHQLRLGGRSWPLMALVSVLLLLGSTLVVRGLDP